MDDRSFSLDLSDKIIASFGTLKKQIFITITDLRNPNTSYIENRSAILTVKWWWMTVEWWNEKGEVKK